MDNLVKELKELAEEWNKEAWALREEYDMQGRYRNSREDGECNQLFECSDQVIDLIKKYKGEKDETSS